MSTMWEPFTKPARRAIVRAQETAALFGSSTIGTEHVLFSLAGGDDDLAAVLAGALDRDALKSRLGATGRAPDAEMTFSAGARDGIARAFAHAHRLGQDFISAPHIALGTLDAEPPPLVPQTTIEELRSAIDRLARNEDGGTPDHGSE